MRYPRWGISNSETEVQFDMHGRSGLAAWTWLPLAGMIVALAAPASAQLDFHRFNSKPYPVVRDALIRLGYRPLPRMHSSESLACYGDEDPCHKWPEIAAYGNAHEGWSMYVYSVPARHHTVGRRRLLIVIANGTEDEVTAVRFANKDDRSVLADEALVLKDEREQGIPTWEASAARRP